MIDLTAARNLKRAVQIGTDSGDITEAALDLIDSIEDEYGDLVSGPLPTGTCHGCWSPVPDCWCDEHNTPKRPTDQIDDPTWRDIHDRDAEIARLKAELEQVEIRRFENTGHSFTLSEWQHAIHEYAKDKGWWDTERPRSFGDFCTLFHSEISEAYEEYRAGRSTTEVYESPNKPGKPEGIPVEIADLVIRVLDWCEHEGIDLHEVMLQKHAYNLTRSYRHGNKRT